MGRLATSLLFFSLSCTAVSLASSWSDTLSSECSYPCDRTSEYCDPIIRMCHHCEDICAEQYVDSLTQCRIWCPSYQNRSAAPQTTARSPSVNTDDGTSDIVTPATIDEIFEGNRKLQVLGKVIDLTHSTTNEMDPYMMSEVRNGCDRNPVSIITHLGTPLLILAMDLLLRR